MGAAISLVLFIVCWYLWVEYHWYKDAYEKLLANKTKDTKPKEEDYPLANIHTEEIPKSS